MTHIELVDLLEEKDRPVHNGEKRFTSMGKGKLGRYCEQAKRWLIPEVWKKWWRKKKKLSKMRAHCKSKSDVQRATCGVP